MDQEAKKLSDKISKRLKKAVKDGMTPDLQEEVNGLLQQLSDITNTISQAESDAKWDTLSAQFSGKEMTADSFDKMQSAINTNIDEIKEGAQEALETANTNTNAKYLRGKITEEEMKKEKKSNAEAYNKTISDAQNKGAEFMYNSLMDTYGRDIKWKYYGEGNGTAISQLIEKMLPSVAGTEYEGKLKTIDKAASAHSSYNLGTWLHLDDEVSAESPAAELAKKYLDTKDFANLDLATPLSKSSKKGGKAAATTIKDTVKTELNSGVSATMPVNIKGNYTVSSDENLVKKDTSNGAVAKNSVKVPGHATGTISTKEHLAMVSEKNKAEAIIPLDGSKRSRSLYRETGRLLGEGQGQSSSVFAPQIHITMSGSASNQDAEKIRKIVEKQVEASYQKMVKKNKRLNMRG